MTLLNNYTHIILSSYTSFALRGPLSIMIQAYCYWIATLELFYLQGIAAKHNEQNMIWIQRMWPASQSGLYLWSFYAKKKNATKLNVNLKF